MDFETLANLGWREGLMAIVALLAIYMAIAFWRMYRLRHPPSDEAPPPPFAASVAVAAYTAAQPQESLPEPAPAPEPPAPALGSADFPFPWNEPPEPDPQGERIEALEKKLARLNKEVKALREETVQLREALKKREEPRKPPLAQMIAPQYSDAMQMALQHHDAATISQQCGISRAEAELVVALVRNRDN